MKLNWGSGIAIFYACFMIAMVSMVIKSCNNKSDLVAENYYQRDLGYEEFRIKKENGKLVRNQLSVVYTGHSNDLVVTFPKSQQRIKGELKLYRPSNKFLDKTYTIKLDSANAMHIPIDINFPNGLWKVQLDWVSNSNSYYNELEFTK